ncbi:VanZ family protein [Aureibaculum sp. A20]|uniref:VanZ family protein n=1 Tax=Aureibaculum flavum TaxID=2795986 RepID=A0ABS0WP51_9FLAO|nr:VanZ family protein [Aureibaculum flavum]MBJ2173742.1 VanZ family protein [Aureibaculum flavum]
MLKHIKQLLERNALIVAIFITLLVTLLSLISLKGVAKINVSNSDKYGHFIAYFTLGVSWLYAFRSRFKRWLHIVALLIIFGMVLEVLQGTLTTYRTADWHDEVANASGVILAYLVSYLWFIKRENLK